MGPALLAKVGEGEGKCPMQLRAETCPLLEYLHGLKKKRSSSLKFGILTKNNRVGYERFLSTLETDLRTNAGDSDTEASLNKEQIHSLFDVVITRDDTFETRLGDKDQPPLKLKPCGDGIRRCAERVGLIQELGADCLKTNVMMVGDSPGDIKAAVDAGAFGVFLEEARATGRWRASEQPLGPRVVALSS